jgi:DNA polymerase
MTASMTLQELQASLLDCQRCRLASGRTQVVFGTGNPHASIMLVGEAPGFYEDKQGEPFVGAAGKLLNVLLGSIGLSRSDIYIANVIKCRPPNNRNPQPDEIATCKPFLLNQIQFIKPHLVCTLGNFATQTLLNNKIGISKVRGRAIPLPEFVVFPLFHPAAALHQGNLKALLVEDFQKLKDVLETMKQKLSDSLLPESPSRTQDQPEPEATQPIQMNLF